MEFSRAQGIYQQISEQLRGGIAGGQWDEGERIPSVRDMAASLGVNPNTVGRSYQLLLDAALIENRRGVGYFVRRGAKEKIVQEMKTEFIQHDLPKVFATINRLGMSIEHVVAEYKGFTGGEKP